MQRTAYVYWQLTDMLATHWNKINLNLILLEERDIIKLQLGLKRHFQSVGKSNRKGCTITTLQWSEWVQFVRSRIFSAVLVYGQCS